MLKTIHTVVFEAAPGGGNPCPVTLHDGTLPAEEMQRMTAAWGEESAFVCPSGDGESDFSVRYFLPLHELGMCLHATIGTTVVLVEEGLATASPIRLKTSLGVVQVDWERRDGQVHVGVWQFLPEVKTDAPSAEELCHVLGITSDVLSPLPVEAVSTSRPKLMVPLRSKAAVDALAPDFEALWALCDRYGVTGLYPFAQEGADFFARQFPNRGGYNEDPATGVAASALGAYLVLHDICPVSEGWNRFTVYQGFAMGRPSVIGADVRMENGAITATRVRGTATIL